MKTILCTLLGIFLLGDGLAFSIEPDKIQTAARTLDETYHKADLKKIAPRLATLIKSDRAVVEQALVVKHQKFSTIAIAKLVSEKTGQDLAAVLAALGDTDGSSAAKEAGLTSAEVAEHLDNLQPEVAFIMLDLRASRR